MPAAFLWCYLASFPVPCALTSKQAIWPTSVFLRHHLLAATQRSAERENCKVLLWVSLPPDIQYLDGSARSPFVFIALVSHAASPIQNSSVNGELAGPLDECQTSTECHFLPLELRIGLTVSSLRHKAISNTPSMNEKRKKKTQKKHTFCKLQSLDSCSLNNSALIFRTPHMAGWKVPQSQVPFDERLIIRVPCWNGLQKLSVAVYSL